MAPVPAKQYPQFIEAFEQKVTEYQKDIARMNNHQDIYSLCKECIDNAKLEEDIMLELSPYGVRIRLYANDQTQEHIVIGLTRAIGIRLLALKLHSDGEPARGHTGSDFQFLWSLALKDPTSKYRTRTITFDVDVPWNGTKYIEVDKETKFTSYIHAVPRWKTGPAPNSLGFTYTPFSAEAENKDEIPF